MRQYKKPSKAEAALGNRGGFFLFSAGRGSPVRALFALLHVNELRAVMELDFVCYEQVN